MSFVALLATPGSTPAKGRPEPISCMSDAECTVTHARMSRDEASCLADGGTSGGSGSMCSACQPVAP